MYEADQSALSLIFEDGGRMVYLRRWPKPDIKAGYRRSADIRLDARREAQPAFMLRDYDIFEVLPNGSTQRTATVFGLEFAHRRLQELAKHTTNECMAVDVKTRQVVAQMNVPRAKWRATKQVFQITYNEELGLQRAELLRSIGYGVVSVLDNERARILLGSIQEYDLFIVGHAAPEQTRREMVDWLRSKYPDVKILALNPPHQELPNADYNVILNGPETWLPIVGKFVGAAAGSDGNYGKISRI